MATANDKELCNSCRFFSTGDRAMGLCHRYPASVNTSDNNWCGEWQAVINVPLQAMVNAIIEPLIAEKQQKQRGRPKKS